jgi:hypothetical protein
LIRERETNERSNLKHRALSTELVYFNTGPFYNQQQRGREEGKMLRAHWLQVIAEHMARFTATKDHMATDRHRKRERERKKSVKASQKRLYSDS